MKVFEMPEMRIARFGTENVVITESTTVPAGPTAVEQAMAAAAERMTANELLDYVTITLY